jgi:murein DD-endopeptidase MepM/ murein hydrolase activator NlpD
LALLPGTGAIATTAPLPLPLPTLPPPPAPVPPAGVISIAPPPSGSAGAAPATGTSATPTGPVPSGAEALAALGDPTAALPGGDPVAPNKESDSRQGPNDNRGAQQQSYEFDRQQYVMTAQVNALDDSQDAQLAAYAGGGSGQFAWPEQVQTISQGFGCTSVTRAPSSSQCPSGHFHTGLDIAGPNLVDVHAADTGVARIFPGTTGYGNYVIITHGSGYSTLYGHLHDFAVKDGQLVHRGDLIAHEGTTGNSTGPHVHFEIRQGGGYLDPCPFLEGCKGY